MEKKMIRQKNKLKKDKTHMRIKEDFKTEDYYRSVLKKYEADVVLFKDKIASSETRTNMQYVIVTDDISRIVKLKYVLGYDLSDIKEIALDYIDYLGQKTEFKPEELTYNEMACALSYAYLFDIDYALLEYVKGDRKSTRLNSSHYQQSRMPSSA